MDSIRLITPGKFHTKLTGVNDDVVAFPGDLPNISSTDWNPAVFLTKNMPHKQRTGSYTCQQEMVRKGAFKVYYDSWEADGYSTGIKKGRYE